MNCQTPLVVGMGATGMACLRHLNASVPLSIYDTRSSDHPAVQKGMRAVERHFPNASSWSGNQIEPALDQVDAVVASPGIAAGAAILEEARQRGLPILSDIDLFVSKASAPVVGITGTNGKSTVTAMAGLMLESSGFRRGGNLGVPALDILDPKAAGYVLELSSFQLEHAQGVGLELAAITNVAADHLDRHGSLLQYLEIKRRIYRDCSFAVYNADDPWTRPPVGIASITINGEDGWNSNKDPVHLGGQAMDKHAIRVHGKLNRFNAVMAAAVATQMGADRDVVRGTLRTFSGLPHRGQVVRERSGVRYVNDSKATNVSAAVAAIRGFGSNARNLVVLLGGDAKNGDFAELAATVERFVKVAVCFGRDGGAIHESLDGCVEAVVCRGFSDAFAMAERKAMAGDIVLLAPACASFDEFSDFSARGDAFMRLVRGLKP